MDALWVVVVLRLLHVVGGVFWAGAMLVVAWFLVPTVRATGPEGGRVMQELMIGQKLSKWLGIAAAVTVLSGALLYYRAMSTTAGTFGASRPGMAFGAGALAAIIAAIIGGSVSVPTSKKLDAVSKRMQAAGRPDPALAAELQALQAKMAGAARIIAALVLVAAAFMAIARYL